MYKHIICLAFAGLIISTQTHAQTTDSASIQKSQRRIVNNMKDAGDHQDKIDKTQKKIARQQRKIERQEKRREKDMKKAEKEQKKINNS